MKNDSSPTSSSFSSSSSPSSSFSSSYPESDAFPAADQEFRRLKQRPRCPQQFNSMSFSRLPVRLPALSFPVLILLCVLLVLSSSHVSAFTVTAKIPSAWFTSTASSVGNNAIYCLYSNIVPQSAATPPSSPGSLMVPDGGSWYHFVMPSAVTSATFQFSSPGTSNSASGFTYSQNVWVDLTGSTTNPTVTTTDPRSTQRIFPQYVGCYNLNFQKDLTRTVGPYYTIESCAISAWNNQNALFGLTLNGNCFTGDNDALASPYSNSTTQCFTQCASNTAEICGGTGTSNYASIYTSYSTCGVGFRPSKYVLFNVYYGQFSGSGLPWSYTYFTKNSFSLGMWLFLSFTSGHGPFDIINWGTDPDYASLSGVTEALCQSSTAGAVNIGFLSSSEFRFGFCEGGSTKAGTTYTASGSFVGAWHYWVVTYDYPNLQRIIYQDGVQVAKDTNVSPINSLYLTTYNEDFATTLSGGLDELRVYSRLLSPSEVASMTNPQVFPTDNLLMYMPFDDAITTSGGSGGTTVPITSTVSGVTTSMVLDLTCSSCGSVPALYWNSSVCLDVNECLSNPCDSKTTCTNLYGSYSCSACPAGFSGTGKTGCVLANPCQNAQQSGVSLCPPRSACVSTASGFVCTPFIAANSFTLPRAGDGVVQSGGSFVQLNDLGAGYGQQIAFTLVNGNGNYSSVDPTSGHFQIFYGVSANPMQFTCNPTTLGAGNNFANSDGSLSAAGFNTLFPATDNPLASLTYNCPVRPAVGRPFSFTTVFCVTGWQSPDNLVTSAVVLPTGITAAISSYSAVNGATNVCFTITFPESFAYAPPSGLTPLRLYPSGPPANPLVLASTLATTISFAGTGFYNDTSLLQVWYGVGGAKTYPCAMVVELTTYSQMVCQTTVATGTGLALSLTAGAQTVITTLKLSYNTNSPTISRVSGCSDVPNSNMTINCPTVGMTLITIYGSNFQTAVGSTVVLIGGQAAFMVGNAVVDSGTAVVQLPPGAGAGVSIVVETTPVGSTNALYSPLVQWLSYAPPTISSLSGCLGGSGLGLSATPGLEVVGCNRDGGDLLTINGYNFGPSTATVFIGVLPCTNPVQSNTQTSIVCGVPPGKDVDVLVLIIQANGQVSISSQSVAKISYALCPKGSVDSAVSNDCVLCPQGSFSSSDGNPECALCDSGKYAVNNGTTSCSSCSPGTFAATPGSSSCTQCLPGYIAANFGSVGCSACPPGGFAPSPGLASCFSCDAGYVSTGTATQCSPCSPGSFAPSPGQTNCTACSPGTFQDQYNATSCQSCPNGYVQGSAGGFGCSRCPGGTAAYQGAVCATCSAGTVAQPGASACVGCKAGSTPTPDQTSCICAAGYYQNGTDCVACGSGHYSPSAGSLQCTPCAAGSINPTTAQATCQVCTQGVSSKLGGTSCVPCAADSAENDEHTRCLCIQGDYFDTDQSQCIACPVGGDCSAPGVTQFTMATASGYWRSNITSLDFYQCLYAQDCNGGAGAGTCGNNRVGTLCAVCEPGYSAATSSSTCTQCLSHDSSIVLSTFVIIIMIAVIVLLYYMLIRADRKQADKVSARKSFDKEFQDALFEAGDRAFPPVLTTAHRGHHSMTNGLKILIGFLQIITNMTLYVSVPWPTAYRWIASVFSFVNFGFLPFNSLTCAVNVSYYTRFILVTIIPLIIFCCLAVFWMLPWYLLERRDMSDDPSRRQQSAERRWQFWKLVLFTLFLLYPSLSSSIFSYFVCRSVDGVDYLVADFSEQCYSDQWNKFLPYVVFMLIIYAIGIPCLFAGLLYYYRNSLYERKPYIMLNFAYACYIEQAFFFEVLDMIHKLFLTSLMPLFPTPMEQLGAGLVVVGIYTFIILWVRPFVHPRDDRLLLISQSILFLLILSGKIQLTQGSLDTASDVLLSILFVALLILLLLCVALSMINLARLLLRERQRRIFKALYGTEGDGEQALGIDRMKAQSASSRGLPTVNGSVNNALASEHEQQLETNTAETHDIELQMTRSPTREQNTTGISHSFQPGAFDIGGGGGGGGSRGGSLKVGYLQSPSMASLNLKNKPSSSAAGLALPRPSANIPDDESRTRYDTISPSYYVTNPVADPRGAQHSFVDPGMHTDSKQSPHAH